MKKAGIKYEKYTTLNDLENATNKHKKCHIIFAQFEEPILPRIHTFYIRKDVFDTKILGDFLSYNRNAYETSLEIYDLSKFMDGHKFIVGYVIK